MAQPHRPEQEQPIDWEVLLNEIERGQVVPIIGTSLYGDVPLESPIPFDHWLASQIAAKFGLVNEDAAPTRLAEVALAILRAKLATEPQIRNAIVELARTSTHRPQAIEQLAKIRGFQLFLTTSFDQLLERALERDRGRAPISAPGRRQDLPELDEVSSPVVYHLLGSIAGNFAFLEKDILESFHTLVSKKPENLFGELKGKSLLFLGCGFPDWLARLFIRIVCDEPYRDGQPDRSQIIADEGVTSDDKLRAFLNHYRHTIYRAGSATSFVAELHERWNARTQRHDRIDKSPRPPRKMESITAASPHARWMPNPNATTSSRWTCST